MFKFLLVTDCIHSVVNLKWGQHLQYPTVVSPWYIQKKLYFMLQNLPNGKSQSESNQKTCYHIFKAVIESCQRKIQRHQFILKLYISCCYIWCVYCVRQMLYIRQLKYIVLNWEWKAYACWLHMACYTLLLVSWCSHL